ncbi:MAG: SSU ribosomal protein S16P [Parcubacteria group bacterium GW2011_GWC1_40_13]|nr:MAG: SSU ribosomal protein S16P [Parcubacteria group bacterium GW2011_GWC1_40_13]
MGRKNEPSFRIVLVDSRMGPKSGKALEILGSHDFREGKGNNKINGERIKYWISNGAQISETMNNLLISEKVISGKKINVLPKKKPIVKELKEEAKKEAVEPSAPVATETPTPTAPAA